MCWQLLLAPSAVGQACFAVVVSTLHFHWIASFQVSEYTWSSIKAFSVDAMAMHIIYKIVCCRSSLACVDAAFSACSWYVISCIFFFQLSVHRDHLVFSLPKGPPLNAHEDWTGSCYRRCMISGLRSVDMLANFRQTHLFLWYSQ